MNLDQRIALTIGTLCIQVEKLNDIVAAKDKEIAELRAKLAEEKKPE